MLVVSTNPPDSLLSALRLRQYEVQETPPHGLPSDPESYLAYQAVILVDVTAAALTPGRCRPRWRAMSATTAAG